MRLHKVAWVLFLICGLIYLMAAIRDGDILMAAGSAFFAVAVILFLFPDR